MAPRMESSASRIPATSSITAAERPSDEASGSCAAIMNQPSSSEGTKPVGRLVIPNQVATSRPMKTNPVNAALRSSPLISEE